MPQAKKPALIRKAISKALYSVSLVRLRHFVHPYSNDAVVESSPASIELLADLDGTPETQMAQPLQMATYTSDELRFISQCEMSLPGCSVMGLSGESALASWLDAWDEAGILSESARAMLGDASDLVGMIERNKLNLADIGEREWPLLGLRALLERVRIELNLTARHGSPVQRDNSLPGPSTATCLHLGTAAPMIEWVRVWLASGMSREIVSAVSGIGFRHLPGSTISQCEMNRASWHVRLFMPSATWRQRSSYVLSGYWYEGKHCTYAYHPMTRDQIPSIDSYNWIAGHRLGVTRQQGSSHPIELIKWVMEDRLSEANGKHCLGLLIEAVPPGGEAVVSRVAPPVLDVIREQKLHDLLSKSALLDAIATNRMPGVYPATWIVQPKKASDSHCTPYLCRVVGEYESNVNAWFHQVATDVRLPGFEAGSFRTAKWADRLDGCADAWILRYQAKLFAIESDDHATAVSAFRLPLGSLLGSVLAINGEQRQCLELAIKQVLGLLKDILGAPYSDLGNLLRWIVFDAINGSLAQMPYRYQVVLGEHGLTLASIPFWSSRIGHAFAEQTLSHFGFHIVIDEDSISALLADIKLTELATVAGAATDELIDFKNSCLTAFKRTEHEVPGQRSTDEEDLADSFRNAKWKAAPLLKKATA